MTNINPLTHKNHINHKTTIKKKKVKEEVQDKVIMSEGSLNLKEVNLKSLQTYSKEAIEVENKPAPFTQTENTSFKTDSPKEWNIVIYMAGDNTLEESMAKNMVDLERYGSSKSINILVQFDRGSRQHRGISPWDGARRFYVTKSDNPDDIISPVKMDLGDINTANPDELKEFIIWAHKEYPAKHTLLIVSNHGGGFAGVANDDSEKSVMSLPDLARALDEAKKALGKDKFDIVGFDCCLMGQTEVAYEIKDHAGIMIGSEEAEGNGGWPYSSIFGENGKLLKSIDSMVRRQVNITP
ncbi:MAG TPA: clostripain-related cysteine peptidase, partial [Candidatus Eremiobacteraeota bacterium]|nr:clostripain-related cysteine peptidase [Candidatus Eremiobacteraeota bacterium]